MNFIVGIFFYTFLILIFLLIILFFKIGFDSSKFFTFLKEKNYKRWCQLTTVGIFGSGGHNIFKFLSYIISKSDNDKEKIVKFKKCILITLKYFLITLLGIIINSAILVYFISRINI